MPKNELSKPDGNLKDSQNLHNSSPENGFKVILSVYEGPIDLLFYIVKKNELDISEISLAKIAGEYQDYVELIKLIDLESAGDFIVFASLLLKIKAKKILQPREELSLEEQEFLTKDSLIKYLMEFEKLGGAAEILSSIEEERIGVFPRGGERNRILETLSENQDEPDYMLFDLLTALRDVLKNAPKTVTHDVELLNVTSEMKQKEILNFLSKNGSIDFIEFVTGQHRIIIVVTFIAMLELIKAGKIIVKQSEQFGKIKIYAK